MRMSLQYQYMLNMKKKMSGFNIAFNNTQIFLKCCFNEQFTLFVNGKCGCFKKYSTFGAVFC